MSNFVFYYLLSSNIETDSYYLSELGKPTHLLCTETQKSQIFQTGISNDTKEKINKRNPSKIIIYTGNNQDGRIPLQNWWENRK